MFSGSLNGAPASAVEPEPTRQLADGLVPLPAAAAGADAELDGRGGIAGSLALAGTELGRPDLVEAAMPWQHVNTTGAIAALLLASSSRRWSTSRGAPCASA